MWSYLKKYFTFSKSERNGFIVLTSVLLVLIIIKIFWPSSIKKSAPDFNAFDLQVSSILKYEEQQEQLVSESELKPALFNPNSANENEWLAVGLKKYQVNIISNFLSKGGKFYKKEDLKKIHTITADQYRQIEPYLVISSQFNDSKSVEKAKNQYFEFDPNLTGPEDFIKLGLSEKQIKVINNYLAKGGRFKTKEDFKKIYCISPKQFEELDPYISISQNVKNENASEDAPIDKIELNGADSSDFRKIKSISPYVARNIVRYREALGGFYSIEQLKEVKYMSSEIYNILVKHVTIDHNIRKLNLNKCSFTEMVRHPYIDYDNTKAILNYRKIMGVIKQPKELIENKIVADSIYQKIKNYITIE